MSINALDRLNGIPFAITIHVERDVYGPNDEEGCFHLEVEITGAYEPKIDATWEEPGSPDDVIIGTAIDQHGNHVELTMREEEDVLALVRKEFR